MIIIQTFKVKYLLEKAENDKIIESVEFINKAWREVSKSTIVSC